MAIRTLSKIEADIVAIDYLTTRNRADTYKLFNPQWEKLKSHTVHCYTHDLFKQPHVQHSIIERQTEVVEQSMANLGLNMETQLQTLIDIADEARRAKQYSAAVSAVKDQNHLLKLYDQVSDDALEVDIKMARPAIPIGKTA